MDKSYLNFHKPNILLKFNLSIFIAIIGKESFYKREQKKVRTH